jgi:hypothetical protein
MHSEYGALPVMIIDAGVIYSPARMRANFLLAQVQMLFI